MITCHFPSSRSPIFYALHAKKFEVLLFLASQAHLEMVDEFENNVVCNALKMRDVPVRFVLYAHIVFFKTFRLQMSLSLSSGQGY